MYAQWISISVKPRKLNLNIQNARTAWGKFHKEGNKDFEIPKDDINKLKVSDGTSVNISSCGRVDSASGTEGSIDIYDAATAKKIGTFSWDNPWGSKTNYFDWLSSDTENYVVQVQGGNKDSGAIGTVTITVAKMP